MTDKDTGVYFKKLTALEKESKLLQLCRLNKSKLVIWEKGSKDKRSVSAKQFTKSNSSIELYGKLPDGLIDKEILLSFELSGLHFFGAAKVSSVSKKVFFIDFSNDLFKGERRANFRLLTYPHQDVYLYIQSPQENSDSNLVSLKTGTTETGLFTHFLKILEDDKEESATKLDGYVKLRVIDASVTGLAVQLSEIENKVLENNDQDLDEMILDFNGTRIKIPNGKFVYKLDFLAPDKKTKMFKGGIQFLGVDTNLDEELANIINKTLRSLESEFEDFLK
jgi:hypothetical protein